MLKFIALRFATSGAVIEVEETETAVDALAFASEKNTENLSVGYEPDWVVYLVEGQNWIELTVNNVNSWARYEFMQFLKTVGGSYAGFHVANFEAPDREDF